MAPLTLHLLGSRALPRSWPTLLDPHDLSEPLCPGAARTAFYSSWCTRAPSSQTGMRRCPGQQDPQLPPVCSQVRPPHGQHSEELRSDEGHPGHPWTEGTHWACGSTLGLPHRTPRLQPTTPEAFSVPLLPLALEVSGPTQLLWPLSPSTSQLPRADPSDPVACPRTPEVAAISTRW